MEVGGERSVEFVDELATEGSDPDDIASLLRSLVNSACGVDAATWLIDAVSFLDTSMARYLRVNQYSEIKFELLMLRADLVAYIEKSKIRQPEVAINKSLYQFDDLWAAIGSDNLTPAARALVQLQQAISTLISARELSGEPKMKVVRMAVEAFRESYKLLRVFRTRNLC